MIEVLYSRPTDCNSNRIWDKGNKFRRRVTCSSSQKRNTFSKSQKPSTNKELPFWEKHLLMIIFMNLLKLFTTVLSSGRNNCLICSPECCIICLVYINRLIAFTEMPLQPTNWRPVVLCSLLVAQKVWDDRYLSNADFAFIYPFFVTDEINKLEQKFLELI